MPQYSASTRKSGPPRYVSSSLPAPKKGAYRFMSKQVGNKRAIGSKESTDYIASILKPGSKKCVRIPDYCLYPTATSHTEVEGTFVGNGNNVCQLVVTLQAGGLGGDGWGGQIYTSSAASTDALFAYGAATAVRTQSTAYFNSYFSSRLVSASLEIQYIGNDNNNQGRLIGATLVKDEYLFVNFDTTNEILQARDQMSVAPQDGLFLRYRPIDESCFNFVKTNDSTTPPVCAFIVAATGIAGANAPFRYKLSCNWENIVRSDQYDQPIAGNQEVTVDPNFGNTKAVMPSIPSVQTLTVSTINSNDGDVAMAEAEAEDLLAQSSITDDIANALYDGAMAGITTMNPVAALGAGAGSLMKSLGRKYGSRAQQRKAYARAQKRDKAMRGAKRIKN